MSDQGNEKMQVQENEREQEKIMKEPTRFVRPDTAPEPTSVIGVFGMSGIVRESDLIKFFSDYGKVQKAYVVCDRFTKDSRGFGFVYFETIEEATTAIEKTNGVVFCGREIRVDYSVTQKPHEPTPGKFFGKETRRPRYYRNEPYYGRDFDRYQRMPRYEGRYDEERGGYRDERYVPRYSSRNEYRRPTPYTRYNDRNRDYGNYPKYER